MASTAPAKTSSVPACFDWAKECRFRVTVSDLEGNLIYQNDESVKRYSRDGVGLGDNMIACHPPHVQEFVKRQLRDGIAFHKVVKDKLVVFEPWYKDGKYSGIVEIIMPFQPKTQPELEALRAGMPAPADGAGHPGHPGAMPGHPGAMSGHPANIDVQHDY